MWKHLLGSYCAADYRSPVVDYRLTTAALWFILYAYFYLPACYAFSFPKYWEEVQA